MENGKCEKVKRKRRGTRRKNGRKNGYGKEERRSEGKR
jgi:hypothetical protein